MDILGKIRTFYLLHQRKIVKACLILCWVCFVASIMTNLSCLLWIVLIGYSQEIFVPFFFSIPCAWIYWSAIGSLRRHLVQSKGRS